MADQAMLEFSTLRSTIRERGTARVVLIWLGIAIWAALLLVLAAAIPIPAAVLVPLMLLLATFEVAYTLHVGIERVGRYLQVFHRDEWEIATMAFAQRSLGGGPDPLYSVLFSLAVLVNLLPLIAFGPTPAEWVPLGLAHALVLVRIERARRRAGRQRAEDLARFQAIAEARLTTSSPS